MVKLIGAFLYYNNKSNEPVLLNSTLDASQFNYFMRTTMIEYLNFGCRTIAQRTNGGTRQTVEIKDVTYLIHSYVRMDSLACCVVSDVDYPQRIAYSLICILQPIKIGH
jgi:synaptobrevin family protein YKT6